MYRYKDILCELPELQFMMSDKNSTVVDSYDLVAVDDDFIMKDLEAAKSNYFDTVVIADGSSFTYISLEEAFKRYDRA